MSRHGCPPRSGWRTDRHPGRRASSPGSKGPKPNAIGVYLSNIVIGVASTAPAYSLAATLGYIVAVGGLGVHSPAVMIVAFLPMLFVAVGYWYLNRADPDCGTTFAWVTRSIGPNSAGSAAGRSSLPTSRDGVAGADRQQVHVPPRSATRAPSTFWLIVGSVVWIALMTWICYRGIELSARIQSVCSASRSSR